MPYVNNGSVRIHYQVEGEGPALVLQHGFTENLVDWYEAGYVEALEPHYRLISSLMPGAWGQRQAAQSRGLRSGPKGGGCCHGAGRAEHRKGPFLGYSMGGWIGFGIANMPGNGFAL